MRRLLDGLFYVVRTGCQWRHLPPPPTFPPWPTVYRYFRAFLEAGVWESIRHHLVTMLREQEGREPSPTMAIIDTQSVKTTEKGGYAAMTRPRRSKGASATSRSMPRVLDAARQLGAELGLCMAGVLHKPVRAAELKNLLVSLLDEPVVTSAGRDGGPVAHPADGAG